METEDIHFDLQSSNDTFKFVAGIAHDFNNIYSIILGNIFLAKKDIGINPKVSNCLSAAEKAAKNAQDLSQLLMSYFHDDLQKESVSIVELTQQTVDLLLRNSNIKIYYDFPQKELILWCNKVEIKQIIWNIVINAKQAMNDKGIIKVNVKKTTHSQSNRFNLPSGEYAFLSFEDNGIGIKNNATKKIFSSSFSTKSEGHGLGLAICHFIVKKYNGQIKAYSNKNKTRFEVVLPLNENFKRKDF